MNCPICKTEMEKGSLSSFSSEVYWDNNHPTAKAITAWKCPKCGKVELTTEVEK